MWKISIKLVFLKIFIDYDLLNIKVNYFFKIRFVKFIIELCFYFFKIVLVIFDFSYLYFFVGFYFELGLENCGSISVWFLGLGYKRYCCFYKVFWIFYFKGS